MYNFRRLCSYGSTNANGTPKSEYLDTSDIKGNFIEF